MDVLQRLAVKTDSKIVLLVLDGLGGLPGKKGTELEVAKKPNMEQFAQEGALGDLVPVLPGITPGSGPGHLGLFGYDPLVFDIGRGILSALGVNFPIEPGDIAARINFCTVDENGNVTDRRAGRIPNETCIRLSEKLDKITVDGVEIFFRPEKEHRAAMVFRGKGLSGNVADTDPQKTGRPPEPVQAASALVDADTKRMLAIVEEFLAKAKEVLKDEHPANMILTRGIAKFEPIPSMGDLYGLSPACIATYPMYRGVSRLVGMEVLEAGDTPESEFECLKSNWDKHDFFYVHVKKTDSYGEDGNFEAKQKVIEQVDKLVTQIRELNPAILAITGDHSTPSQMKAHSFHPIPLLLWGENVRRDHSQTFGETACAQGGVGRIDSKFLMSLLLGHAGKLDKFGA